MAFPSSQSLLLASKLACLGAMVWSLPVVGQSAVEHHIWQDQSTFKPMSRTAIAITGAIALTGNPSFAEVGSTTKISFDGGEPIELSSVGASWRQWSLNGETRTAEVFRLASDPGTLRNGNALCGDPVRYLVFSEGSVFGGDQVLEIAMFSSKKAPFDINSEGLCATFSYLVQ
ncbi:hypothetical protein ABIB57_000946 [Devosia sp. UYZn731]|uniref:hypothetical protein n=1 Tax=Devosia sp. UYZn731 TaxID=3156345 RepID=UPI003391A0FC